MRTITEFDYFTKCSHDNRGPLRIGYHISLSEWRAAQLRKCAEVKGETWIRSSSILSPSGIVHTFFHLWMNELLNEWIKWCDSRLKRCIQWIPVYLFPDWIRFRKLAMLMLFWIRSNLVWTSRLSMCKISNEQLFPSLVIIYQKIIYTFPAGTRRRSYVATTSIQHHDVVWTF